MGGIVFTKLPMGSNDVKRREKNRGKSDRKFAADYVKDLKDLYCNNKEIKLDTFFLDACYDKEDDYEVNIFRKELESLWNLIDEKNLLSTSSMTNIIAD